MKNQTLGDMVSSLSVSIHQATNDLINATAAEAGAAAEFGALVAGNELLKARLIAQGVGGKNQGERDSNLKLAMAAELQEAAVEGGIYKHRQCDTKAQKLVLDDLKLELSTVLKLAEIQLSRDKLNHEIDRFSPHYEVLVGAGELLGFMGDIHINDTVSAKAGSTAVEEEE